MGTQSKRQRRKDRNRERTSSRSRSILKSRIKLFGTIFIVAGAAIGFFVFSIVTAKTLPPTGFGPGHSELLPPEQVNARPIPPAIQEHVMERNATHPVGQMLVQYNCVEYDCEIGLAQTLERIVTRFPRTVYLAPYPTMDAMIALAAPGRLEVLDTFDEAKITKFIRDNLNR